MTRLPRTSCPECGRDVPLRVNGHMREHDRAEGGDRCPASGLTVDQAERAIDKELARLRQMGGTR